MTTSKEAKSSSAPPPTKAFPFSHVVITFPDTPAAQSAADGPLQALQQQFFYVADDTPVHFIASCDPWDCRVGSGGGTLAALDQVARQYSLSLNNNGNDSTTKDWKILIVHAGGASSRCPTQMVLGKAWTSLPCRLTTPQSSPSPPTSTSTTTTATLETPLSLWMHTCQSLFAAPQAVLPPKSVVVVASDTLLKVPASLPFPLQTTTLPTTPEWGVVALSVPAAFSIAKNHGVFAIPHTMEDDPKKNDPTTATIETSSCPTANAIFPCTGLWQKPSLDTLQKECRRQQQPTTSDTTTSVAPSAWIDTGLLVFGPAATQALVQLMEHRTLWGCTRTGLEHLCKEQEPESSISPTAPVAVTPAFAARHTKSVDLYTDILGALQRPQEESSSSSGPSSSSATNESSSSANEVTSVLKQVLSHIPLKIWTVEEGVFLHLGTTRELMQFYQTTTTGEGESEKNHKRLQQTTVSGDAVMLDIVRRVVARHWGLQSRCETLVEQGAQEGGNNLSGVDSSAVVFHSWWHTAQSVTIGAQAVVEHCRFLTTASVSLGTGCLVSGLRGWYLPRPRNSNDEDNPCASLVVPPHIMIQQVCMVGSTREKDISSDNNNTISTSNIPNSSQHQFYVYMVLGIDDGVKDATTLYQRPLSAFLEWAGLSESDLWPVSPSSDQRRTLWTGQLHPIVTGHDEEDSFPGLFGWLAEYCDRANDKGKKPSAMALESLARWKARRRISLADIREQADANEEFRFRKQLEHKLLNRTAASQDVVDNQIRQTLLERKHDAVQVLPNYSGLLEEYVHHLVQGSKSNSPSSTSKDFLRSKVIKGLETLDEVVLQALTANESSASPGYDVAGRAWMLESHILYDVGELAAAVIQSLPDATFQLESLPATHYGEFQQKLKAIGSEMQTKLQGHVTNDGMKGICKDYSRIRNQILSQHPNLLIPNWIAVTEMLARQMLMRCMSPHPRQSLIERVFTNVTAEKELVLNQWVVVSAPARIDLAGGWSDTPPICMEFGSSVTGIAVTVDGRQPLACRARLRRSSVSSANKSVATVRLRSEGRNFQSGQVTSTTTVDLNTVGELNGYNDPAAECALQKCALVILGFGRPEQIMSKEDVPLNQVLESLCKSRIGKEDEQQNGDVAWGLDVVITTFLPHGSGLGSSSILAGCMLAALARCFGIEFGPKDQRLMEYVLLLEQELTSGGGFQDQVNGLIGGAKMVSCEPFDFPLKLKVEGISLQPAFAKELDKSLVLVFTGKTRLAKNILQQCLRRWTTRSSEIMKVTTSLVATAHASREALARSDLEDLGRQYSAYWEQKKCMAGPTSGVEPQRVTQLLQTLHDQNLVHGASLCGAGGGGFLALLLSDPTYKSTVATLIAQHWPEMSLHEVALSTKGLSIGISQAKSEEIHSCSMDLDSIFIDQ